MSWRKTKKTIPVLGQTDREDREDRELCLSFKFRPKKTIIKVAISFVYHRTVSGYDGPEYYGPDKSQEKGLAHQSIQRGFQAALLAALLLGRPAPALASDPSIKQYVRSSWSSADGLPASPVSAIAQMQDGYLWFGTDEGLVRFNGKRFVIFDQANTPELPSKSILALLVDRQQDVLWIGNYLGGLTRYSQGRFHAYTVQDGLPDRTVIFSCPGRTREGLDWHRQRSGSDARWKAVALCWGPGPYARKDRGLGNRSRWHNLGSYKQ